MTMDTWKRFKEDVALHPRVSPGARILLAVSGGPDSVCLTHLFWRLAKTMPLTLTIAHLNHGLRHEARGDALFVERLGAKLGLPVVTRAIDVAGVARRNKISLETAGREERYAALEDIAGERHCDCIALGHTANDNAETILMWLLRGTGPDGLCGIPRERPAGKSTVIRPLLSVPRLSIMAYLRSQHVSYRTDRSNRSDVFTRNRIRRHLIPLMESFNPQLVEHLTRLSRLYTDECVVLRRSASAAARRCVRAERTGFHLAIALFIKYNRATQLRILKNIVPEMKSYVQVERIMRLVYGGRDGRHILSATWEVIRSGSSLMFIHRRGRAGSTGSQPPDIADSERNSSA